MPLPLLSTDRLEIRPIQVSDIDVFHAIWGDPEVIWWGAATDRAASAEALKALVARCEAMDDGLGWSWLVDATTGETVGDVALQPAPDPPGGIEIGWHLARSAWGRGYATEGARPLLPHAWGLGLHQVVAMIVPVNQPSIRLAERLGMERRGETIERGGLAHGVWVVDRP